MGQASSVEQARKKEREPDAKESVFQQGWKFGVARMLGSPHTCFMTGALKTARAYEMSGVFLLFVLMFKAVLQEYHTTIFCIIITTANLWE